MRASPCQRLNSAKLQGGPSALGTSCVNSALQRKVVSPQWDSRARPAKRQHRRCIGCEKRPCLISLACWFAFVTCASFITASVRMSQTATIFRLSSKPTPIDVRMSVVSFAFLMQAFCKQSAGIRAPQLHQVSNRCAGGLLASLAFAAHPMTGRGRACYRSLLKPSAPLGSTQAGSRAPTEGQAAASKSR